MALPVSFYSETLADNTIKSNGEPETASWSVAITTLTAANLVAQTTLINNLHAAVAALVLGNFAKEETVVNRSIMNSGPASSPLAQRENKLLLRYHGQTLNKKFRVSIPTFDLTVLMPNSEFVDLTTGAGAALKTAFEAIVKSPNDATETVVLDSAQFVGRNS